MPRFLLAAAVVVADTAIAAAAHAGAAPAWALAAFAGAAALLAAAARRWPPLALTGALALAAVSQAAYCSLLWTACAAGHALGSRRDAALVAGAAAGSLVARAAAPGAGADALPHLVTLHLVFVLLPCLTGRYLAQHRRLVETLERYDRSWAERERLRERLRIAREVHDSLGHRLSLVSVQAAALEVADLPPEQRETTRHLARAARDALTDLHGLVGALRAGEPDGPPGPAPDAAALAGLAAEFRTAGMDVSFTEHGTPPPLPAETRRAAYRVVEEGLSNAARHAPGRPVAVSVTWEPDAVLLAVATPLPGAAPAAPPGGGHGLRGLAERARAAGGFADHQVTDGEFRLRAMLPAAPRADDRPAAPPAGPGPARTTALALASAACVLLVLPASMLVGLG